MAVCKNGMHILLPLWNLVELKCPETLYSKQEDIIVSYKDNTFFI